MLCTVVAQYQVSQFHWRTFPFFIATAVVALTSRPPEEATSRRSDSKDPREEAEETRAELTDVEDRNEAGAWQGLNLNRVRIPAFSGTDAIRIGTSAG